MMLSNWPTGSRDLGNLDFYNPEDLEPRTIEGNKNVINVSRRFHLRHVDAADGQGLETDENGAILVTLSTLKHDVESIPAAFDEMRILKRECQLKLGVLRKKDE